METEPTSRGKIVHVKGIQKELEQLEKQREKKVVHVLTEREKLKELQQKEKERKQFVKEIYKEETGKEMDDEKYNEYVEIYDDPQIKKYSIYDFIDGVTSNDSLIKLKEDKQK